MVIKVNIMVVYQTSVPYENKKDCTIKLNNKKTKGKFLYVSYLTLSLN